MIPVVIFQAAQLGKGGFSKSHTCVCQGCYRKGASHCSVTLRREGSGSAPPVWCWCPQPFKQTLSSSIKDEVWLFPNCGTDPRLHFPSSVICTFGHDNLTRSGKGQFDLLSLSLPPTSPLLKKKIKGTLNPYSITPSQLNLIGINLYI